MKKSSVMFAVLAALLVAGCASQSRNLHPWEVSPQDYKGERILFVGHVSWGSTWVNGVPAYLNRRGDGSLSQWDLKTEEACHAEAKAKNSREIYPPAGRIGNLPGYRYVLYYWCEDPSAAWPTSQPALRPAILPVIR